MKKTLVKKNSATAMIGSALLALSLSACDSSPTTNQWKSVAPQSKSQVGVILKGAQKTEVDQWLSQHPEATAREVSAKHKIYEIKNINVSQLKANFQKYDVYENDFYQLKPLNNPHKSGQLQKQWKAFAEGENATSSENPFSTCLKDVEPPQSTISAIFPALQLSTGSVELGTTIALSGQGSLSHPKHISPLKKTWFMLPPAGSAYQPVTHAAKDIQFKPDAVGSYQMGLLVQDNRNVCSFTPFGLIVTHNPGFQGPQHDLTTLRTQHNLNAFKHLAELGTTQSWDISEGQGILIAVIDTGVNYNHPALAHNIFTNSGEIPNNGIDDDNNGYIDDFVGFDFANSDSDPFDDQGHGSHVAGLAGSSVFGVARSAKILPVKALGPNGGDPASVAAAIFFAVDRGASVINLSLGGGSKPHPLMLQAMDYAAQRGVIIIAAAGNGDEKGQPMNIDLTPIFPAALPNNNLVSVAAKDSVGLLAPYSNFGPVSVDVVAPGGGFTRGDQIYSCTTQNNNKQGYVGLQGTSMAAPIVSGIVAQVRALNPRLSPAQIRSLLMSSGTPIKDLQNYVQSGKYLNGLKAVQRAQLSAAFM